MKTKLLLMLLAIALVAGAAQANMLTNPSFEDGAFDAKSAPDDWEISYESWLSGWTWMNNDDDDPDARTGTKHLKLNAWWTGSYNEVYQWVTGMKENDDYSFSVWARSNGTGKIADAELVLYFYDSASVQVGSTIYTTPVSVGDEWTYVEWTHTTPPGTVAAYFSLYGIFTNGYFNPDGSINPDGGGIHYDDANMIGPDPNIHAGPDMISWDGQTVSLTGSTSLVESYSTIKWSADPNYCAVITDGDTLTPSVQVNPIIESGPAIIANHSFENGLTGWATASGSGHGTWDGTGWDPNDLFKVYYKPTDGRLSGYVDGVSDGLGQPGQIYQILANNLVAANTTYTLMVDVVNDGYYEEDVQYRVQLRAGTGAGSVLAKDNNTQHALDTYGVWETSIVTYNSGATPAKLGLPMEIRLVAIYNANGTIEGGTGETTNEMTFDNVRLTANPPFPAYVPDILTYTMTVEIDGNKFDTMKIDVYPDACAAKLGADLREVTDLVGDDCITDLPDLDELLKTWTVDNALTEPWAKVQEQGPGTGPGLVPGGEQIAIVNAGFEDPEMADGTYIEYCDGWEPFGDAWYGVCNPAASGGDYYGFGGITPEGENLMSVGGGDAEDRLEMYIAQILTETLAANTAYELTVEVGNNPMYDWFGYRVQLLAGGEVIAEDDSSLTPDDNVWETSTVTYISRGINPYVGELLEIRLMALGFSTADNYLEINFDDVRLRAGSADIISPLDYAYIHPTSELELTWTNMDPNNPADSVWVDILFGTEPNKTDPGYNMTRIVDAVEDANSTTVDVSSLGTYYWQRNSYIYGDPGVVGYDTGDPNTDDPNVIKGPIWRFHVVDDIPVSVVAGHDWVTWSGQKVSLASAVIDDGVSTLMIGWTANPTDGVSWPEGSDVLDPNVVITKATDNPSIVTLRVTAEDGAGSVEATIMIDVYDTACLAAIGLGAEYDPGDIDKDCDTDLGDFAAIGEEWLVYRELTTSIVKP